MDFVRARIEIIEQALRVKCAAGSGDGNENFHRVENYVRTAHGKQAVPETT
jgi:hypothetical protein